MGDTHQKVQCWIFATNKNAIQCLLLQTNKQRGEFWQPVTGSVEPGEKLLDAARREVLEETGFPMDVFPVETGYVFEFESRFGPAIETTFCIEVDKVSDPVLDPKEHQSFKWVTPKEALPILKFPTNVEGLKKSYFTLYNEELR